jgi:D-alanyl-D-alanine carboxypeptidase
LGGSVEGFAQRMNAKAQALGMTRTVFRNPNGLPNFEQHTTARDLARLAMALYRDFPQYYPLFAETRFTFRGRVLLTHNRFMLSYPGADGLKTGYISASGYNLAASATRNGRRIVGVVLGGRSPTLRDAEMWALLDQGFGTATPPGSNNALLLASAAALPSLKPGDAEGDGGAEDDSLEDGTASPATNAMQAALPSTPAQAPAPPPAPKVASSVVASTATVPTVGYSAPSTAPMAPIIELQVLQPAAAPAQQPTTLSAPSKLAVLPALKPGAADTAAAGEANGSLASGTRTWGIQVGAYNRYASARKAALRARAKLPAGSPQTRIAVDESRGANGKLYRARLIGFAQAEAAQACRALKAHKLSCMVIPTNMAVAETSQ